MIVILFKELQTISFFKTNNILFGVPQSLILSDFVIFN